MFTEIKIRPKMYANKIGERYAARRFCYLIEGFNEDGELVSVCSMFRGFGQVSKVLHQLEWTYHCSKSQKPTKSLLEVLDDVRRR